MHHVIAGLQIELVGGECAQMLDAGFSDGLRKIEQIFCAEYGEAALLEYGAARDIAADESHRSAAGLRPFTQVFRRAIARQIDLVRH